MVLKHRNRKHHQRCLRKASRRRFGPSLWTGRGRGSRPSNPLWHHKCDLKARFQLKIGLNRRKAPNVTQDLQWEIRFYPFQELCSFRDKTENILFTTSEDRWSRIQIFSIRAASLPLDGIEQNSIYKWPLNGCIYQIIAACRFHKLRLIRTSLESENIMK